MWIQYMARLVFLHLSSIHVLRYWVLFILKTVTVKMSKRYVFLSILDQSSATTENKNKKLENSSTIFLHKPLSLQRRSGINNFCP